MRERKDGRTGQSYDDGNECKNDPKGKVRLLLLRFPYGLILYRTRLRRDERDGFLKWGEIGCSHLRPSGFGGQAGVLGYDSMPLLPRAPCPVPHLLYQKKAPEKPDM